MDLYGEVRRCLPGPACRQLRKPPGSPLQSDTCTESRWHWPLFEAIGPFLKMVPFHFRGQAALTAHPRVRRSAWMKTPRLRCRIRPSCGIARPPALATIAMSSSVTPCVLMATGSPYAVQSANKRAKIEPRSGVRWRGGPNPSSRKGVGR